MGPLYYYELVRLARKGRGTLLRCAYVAAGLVALYFVYHGRFPSHDLWDEPFSPGVTSGTRDLASLARDFVAALLWAQTIAVFVLTPAYLAGAIAGERERGTLDLLLTTTLSDREIVLGKVAARLTHLGGILLAGLPLLAATQLWGGVDFRVLLATFAVSGLNLLAVGSVCALCSVRARTAWQAFTSSCTASALLAICCLPLRGTSPMNLLEVMHGESLWEGNASFTYLVLWCAVAGQVAVTLFCLTVAVYQLRSGKTSPARNAGTRTAKAKQPADKAATVPDGPARQSPSVGDHPLLWAEAFRRGVSENARTLENEVRKDWRTRLAFLVVFTAAAAGASFFGNFEERFLLRAGLVAAAVFWCAETGYASAESVGLDRDRRTLDGLLMLPCDRSAVLGAKWLGSVLRSREMGYVTGSWAVLALCTGALHPLAVPLVAASLAGQLCFWASLGVWLSTAFRSTLRARVVLGLALLLVFCGSWFLAAGDPPFNPNEYVGDAATKYWKEPLPGAVRAYSANPIRSWWFLAFRWWGKEAFTESEDQEAPLFGVRLAAAGGGTVAFVLAGGLLWEDACRRFRKE